MQLDLLRDYFKEFSNLSVNQRMTLYHLREDRADVIVPALLIYINVMRWADTEEIYIHDISSTLNMSVAAFSRYFKHHTRKTFSDYVTEIRIGHACRMPGPRPWDQISYM